MPGGAAVETQLRQVQKVPHVSLSKMGKQINLDVAKRGHQPHPIIVQVGSGGFVKRQVGGCWRSLRIAGDGKRQTQSKNGTNNSGKSGGSQGLWDHDDEVSINRIGFLSITIEGGDETPGVPNNSPDFRSPRPKAGEGLGVRG